MTAKNIMTGTVLLIVACSCQPAKEVKTTGSIERLDPALDNIIGPEAKIEIIGEGYDWSEGPLWVSDGNMLLFSDVPQNIVYKWTEDKGVEPYLKPSGYTGAQPRGGEMGSNGLLLDDAGNLVLCQHGDHALAKMLAPLDAPNASFQIVIDKFDGKRLNSPNDAVLHNKNFYFTDPAYGFEKKFEDPLKELPFQGVYQVSENGEVHVLVDSITRPNGIAFSPDGKYLFVANSDSTKARWYRFDFSQDEKGTVALSNGKVFFDVTPLTATEKGLPDGMKIDRAGNIFASGPGGVFIFNPEGKLLGKVNLPDAASNCALSPDDKTLYITNDMYVLRIKLRG